MKAIWRDWLTSRAFRSTSGLITTRESGPEPPRQVHSPTSAAPGNAGPISSAANAATAIRPDPSRSSALGPRAWSPGIHVVLVAFSRPRTVSTNASEATRNARAETVLPCPDPSSEHRTNNVNGGMSAWRGARRVKAAMSAMTATIASPMQNAITKPSVTGTGARAVG